MKYNIDICPYLSWLLISKGIKMDQAENFYTWTKKVSQIHSSFGTFQKLILPVNLKGYQHLPISPLQNLASPLRKAKLVKMCFFF